MGKAKDNQSHGSSSSSNAGSDDSETTTKGSGSRPKTTKRSGNLGQSVSKSDMHVIRELKTLYREKMLPIERDYFFNKFNQPEILDAELGAKASVLLVGQYSTGKALHEVVNSTFML